MTASIGSVARLVSVIQHQLGARMPAVEAGNKHGAASTTESSARYAERNLSELIELRVRQIARDDPQRGRKAFRVFLEAVLISHFGAGVVSDPRFFQMVEDVQLAMEADAECAELVASAIAQLLSED